MGNISGVLTYNILIINPSISVFGLWHMI